ncbi:MAG: acyl-CoA thioesterase [Phycisphaerales bacterium]
MNDRTPPILEQPVAWGDMDALGHVNNAVYFRYMESARVAFLLWLGVDRLRHADGPGVILQSAQARFRRPVTYPDTLRITSRVAAIEPDRFTLEHELISAAQSQVAAVGSGVIVAYDYQARQKIDLPASWRHRLKSLVH